MSLTLLHNTKIMNKMDKNLINKIKNKKIDYIVEWWEDDSLDIDSNQHILFSLENEDIDIIVTEKNIMNINMDAC